MKIIALCATERLTMNEVCDILEHVCGIFEEDVETVRKAWTRAGFHELLPEKEELYRELHADVWPEVVAAIKKANKPIRDVVEVLESGNLALSSGPVRNASGEEVGRFNSIWRKEADGTWRVVFDKGS